MRKAVVVTTEHKGVFFGYLVDDTKSPSQITLSGCRNCVYWPQSVKGFLGLAVSGPLPGSRVGPAAQECVLYDVTSIADCTSTAVEAWESSPWS